MPQPASLRARTKIVATVGPACRSPEMLRELVLAGVDVFRLNMAHGSLEDHTAIVHDLRRLSAELAHPLAMLADLAGPKIRLGELVGGQVECRQGEEVRFVRGGVASAADELVCTYERLLDELAPGDRIMLADGTVSLIVEQVTAADARCRVVQPGTVRTRQGVNLPGVQISLPALSDTDRNHAVWALGQMRAVRALETLKKHYDGRPCTHNTRLCQYELKKAIHRIEARPPQPSAAWRMAARWHQPWE